MAKRKDKLAVLWLVLDRRCAQEKAAWEACEHALADKQQEKNKLLTLQSDYGGQLRTLVQGDAIARQNRIGLFSTITEILLMLDVELGNLVDAESDARTIYRQTLAKKRGVERLRESRLSLRKQQERRRDRQNL